MSMGMSASLSASFIARSKVLGPLDSKRAAASPASWNVQCLCADFQPILAERRQTRRGRSSSHEVTQIVFEIRLWGDRTESSTSMVSTGANSSTDCVHCQGKILRNEQSDPKLILVDGERRARLIYTSRKHSSRMVGLSLFQNLRSDHDSSGCVPINTHVLRSSQVQGCVGAFRMVYSAKARRFNAVVLTALGIGRMSKPRALLNA